jgi:branched-chain amino acid transport system permease protein
MLQLDKRAGDVLIWVLLLTAPYWITHVGSYIELATHVVVYALAAMALNFLLGFTGVLSFGHAAYFGLGAYGTAMTIKYLYPSTFYFIAFEWSSATGGDDGVSAWHRMPLDLGGIRIDILNNPRAFYFFALAMFAVCAAAMAFLLRSPFGRTLLAIRENERRARFLGIPVDRHIWMSWVISCFFVSVAGTLFALMNNFVDPRALRWDQSGNFVIMAVLGGMRSFWGPLIGAAIFLVLQDYISSHTENWMSFIGLFFVLIVLFFPRGVLGLVRRRPAS